MKKLMIAVTIVCAAAYAQAAAYTWGLGSGNDESSSGGYLTDGDFTVVQLIGTVTETANGDGTYALDFSGVSGVLNSTSTANSDYSIGSIDYNAGVTSDAVTQGTPQAFSILVLEAAGADYNTYQGKYALITGTSGASSDPTEGALYMDFTSSDAVTADMYKTAAPAQDVPEPTSGLLMLLGVAGLALRRKRA